MELQELAPKQAEAIKTLCEMDREARRTNPDPNARTVFLTVALLLAKRGVLDYSVAALLKQAQGLHRVLYIERHILEQRRFGWYRGRNKG